MKNWINKVKKYFADNATIFADGMAIMNGSAYGYSLYRNRK